ncbi:MAG: hypothetical protein COB69_07045 [Phycisphaera sp.]|nr:MAG: hypothetical protein COB69_07045 [Phycisphaera sp.]
MAGGYIFFGNRRFRIGWQAANFLLLQFSNTLIEIWDVLRLKEAVLRFIKVQIIVPILIDTFVSINY